ncbi:MAG: polysulfide reductase NrfD [Candidatus Rokubacteria bacterium]|nr:polysulfide reductase NrfD [Candidatus Rokubacteria bacterium]
MSAGVGEHVHAGPPGVSGQSPEPARPPLSGGAPTYADVNRDVIRTLEFPSNLYFGWMSFIALTLAGGVLAWVMQIYYGIGMAGKRNPQMWAMYITTFVFWIGIGHAGTLISAILYLFRARWRTSIYRGSEAMTIFAVMTALLFPVIHLGRMWLPYWLIPYPNDRFLWPNFRSPLLWDVFAISTYFTISAVFFYVGLIPDIAALRDGASGLRRRIYAALALGWQGSDREWRHYRRAYGLLAALATPLVVSVHSVVSWDFAMALLPGWHSTLFAPFFVDGAIFSGFAMVLVLLLPMRYYFSLFPYITDRQLDAMAKLILVTSLVLTYFYACEGFVSWYSGEPIERASYLYKWVGTYAPWWWLQIFCNSVVPLVFFWRRARVHVLTLYIVSVLVLIGMWFERFNIIVPGLARGFYPYTFGVYVPTPVDTMIIIGSFAWFFIWFMAFIKVLPSVSIVEVKETIPHPVRDAATVHH